MTKDQFVAELTRDADSQETVNHPAYYHANTIEVLDVLWAWKLSYNRGCVVKYIARAGLKDPSREIEDLQKAICYIEDEIKRLRRDTTT